MVKKFLSVFYVVVAFIIVNAALCSGSEKGIINTPGGLSLRSDPRAGAKLLLKMPNKAEIEVLAKNGPVHTIEKRKSPWFKVRYKNKTGWAFGGFISIKNSSETADGDTGKQAAENPGSEKPEKTEKQPEVDAASFASAEAAADRDFVRNEKAMLKKWSKKISRSGKTLKLKCSGGKKVELIDDDSDGESYVSYYCIDYFSKEGLYLVYGQLYEGSEHFFVSEKTGKTIVLGDMPIFSPKRSRIAVAGLDIMAAYDFNGLRIFRFKGNELEKEYEIIPDNWGAQSLKWVNEESITFEKVSGYEGKVEPAKLTFDSKSKSWQLQ